MYNPKVSHPSRSVDIAPTRSSGFQPLFYFGGAQTPINLGLAPNQDQGSHESFYQHKQVDAQKYKMLIHKKTSPVKVLPK